MALNEAVRCRRRRGASCSRSRTTSDFEILRPRDSASISATSGSGNRTVRVFMETAYYMSGDDAIRGTAEPGVRSAPSWRDLAGILAATKVQCDASACVGAGMRLRGLREP